MKKDCYVYIHRKKESNELFYVGIGSDGKNHKRAFSKHRRNPHWKNIVIKYDFTVEIIIDNITWEEACNKEKELIKQYGRSDLKSGILCNQTDGGDGNYGRIMSEKCKQATRKVNIGNKYALGIRFKRPEETKKRMRKPKSEEHIKNISKGKLGLKLSEESKLLRNQKIRNKYKKII